MEMKPVRCISYKADLVYRYSAGKAASRFLVDLRDNKKIMATRCQKCGTTYIPPRSVCGQCFVTLNEWVEVGPQGTLTRFTVVQFPFWDPISGSQRAVPYVLGFIHLDGADLPLQHYLEKSDSGDLKVGARVEPVFKTERFGTLADIEYFRIVG